MDSLFLQAQNANDMQKCLLIIVALFSSNFFFGQNINFSDPNFKSALLDDNSAQFSVNEPFESSVDTDNDGEISFTEAEAVVGLSIDGENISSLSEISFFINLKFIDCSQNNISSLDFSNNMHLEEIRCTDNAMSSLNITNNALLEDLDCSFNNLTSLDLSNNLNLLDLYCDNNLLTTVNTSNNTNLTNFFCRDNEITNLDVANNLNLRFLGCAYNLIGSLDVSNNVNLEHLYCQDNEITILNFGTTTSLETIHCWDNNISNLELNNFLNLISLYCGDNNLNSLNVTNNTNLESLYFDANNITSLDISLNTELIRLNASSNQLNDIDVSNNITLEELRCSNNVLPSLNIENNINLISLYASNSNLTTLDFSNNTNLETVSIRDNQFENLNLNHNPNLFELDIRGNMDLISVFLKNGSTYPIQIQMNQLTNLEYICIDDFNISHIQQQLNDFSLTNVAVNTLCTFTPGGTFYTVEGQTTIDLNNNGCNTNFPFLKLLYTNTNDSDLNGSYITDSNGNFSVPLQAGNYTFNVELENASFYSFNPDNLLVNFPSDTSPWIQNFCLTPNNTFSDLEVLIVPIENAIPGFNSRYKIIYRNKGDSVASGDITFTYSDDDVMTFLSSNPAIDSQNLNTLNWNFIDLLPFESREILLDFSLNTPMDTPPLNGDDYLSFDTSINPTEGDASPGDNNFSLKQKVINSFDPNDITCLEGDVITPDKVGEFVHYLIRFENTGTANATNVVLKDVLNTSMFDISTLTPLNASHNFYTRIQNDNVAEFIFENIDLPFDDANNDGYVLFKIKTLNSLVEGDIFDNQAGIYFDFNFPIITNIAETTVATPLHTQEFELADNSILLYPNPVNDQLHLQSKQDIKQIILYDIAGRNIKAVRVTGNKTEVDLSTESLASGTYFVKIKTEQGETVKKMIKD